MTEVKKPALVPSQRLTLAVLCFFGCLVVYSLRTNMSMAIVCMVKTDPNATQSSSKQSQCATTKDVELLTSAANPMKTDEVLGEFDWSIGTQGSVLSAFFWGYLCSQVLGGYLATRFGGKRVIVATIFGASLITLISPLAARTHAFLLVAMRALVGFFQGATFPAMHTMWSVWGPPLEVSLLTGVSYAGAQIGNMLVLPISGLLCKYGFDGGWPTIFYSFGLVGVLWCVIWQFATSDRPSNHPRISKEEMEYIEGSLEATMGKSTDKPRSTPWCSILSSRAVWACWFGHFAGDWGAYTMMVSMPSFLKDVLGLDLSSLGFVSAVPYLAYFLMINFGGAGADYLRNKGILGTLNTRRLAMLLALVGQGVFLILSSYCGCGQDVLVIVFITIGMALSGLQYAGFVVNYLDIAPPFSGTIMGMGNTLSCFGGIISPVVTSLLTPNGTQAEWQTVMWLTGGILIGGALLFTVLARGEVESWAKSSPSGTTEEEIPLKETVKEA